MNKKNIRLLFALAFVLMLTQFALSLAGLQPYPAIIFPEFSHPGGEIGRFEYDKPEFIAITDNGENIRIDELQLFNTLPLSFLPTVLKKKLRYENFYEEKWKFGQGHKLRLHSYVYEFKRMPPTYSERDYNDFKSFMKNRLVSLTGKQDMSRLNVKWFKYRHYHHDGKDDIEKELEYEFDLNFNN